MRLLVSVANAAEVSAALAGGADLVDAKDPRSGALGAVAPPVLHAIIDAVGGARPVTAAIGDATDDDAIERTACAFAAAGTALVKVGFAGITSPARVAALAVAARRGVNTSSAGLVLVAYADADRVASIAPAAVVDVAARTGARGVLLDTADKSGPGLRALVTPAALAAFVAHAHQNGLLVALAGRLAVDDLAFVRDAGADKAGVRGAACEGGRTGRVRSDLVRRLRARCEDAAVARAV